jgi:hypothetical protein
MGKGLLPAHFAQVAVEYVHQQVAVGLGIERSPSPECPNEGKAAWMLNPSPSRTKKSKISLARGADWAVKVQMQPTSRPARGRT